MLDFINKLLPGIGFDDPDLQRRGRLLVAGSIGFFLICFLFGIQMALLGEYPTLSIIIVFSGCGLALLNLFLLKLTRSTILPGVLFCLEAMAIIAFQAFSDLGMEDPVLLWYIIIPWLAAFLIRPIYGFVFAGLVTVIIGGFYVLEMQGYPFPHRIGEAEAWLYLFLQLSALALYVGFLGWVYEGQTLKNLQASNKELRSARDALQESNKRIESILESITDGFFAMDSRWRFTYINHRAEQIFGTDRSELLGTPADEHFAEQISSKVLRRIRAAARANTFTRFVTFYQPLDRWFEVRVYPFATGLSVYFNDVTDRKTYEEGLIEAKERAEELARLKSAFLTNMSHEIRTPLTGIIGFASVLAKELEDEHREFAELIETNGRRLMNTLNSVLDLARLESDPSRGEPEPLDVAEEAEEAVRLLTPMAQEKGLYLQVERTAKYTQAVADKTFMNRILNNLIGNAIKFTDEGGITVRVGGSRKQVQLQVADTGIGISEGFIPHLFDEFRQESTGMSRSHQGSGLGLAITRHLVEAMQGTITVDSTKGAGSVFTVRFPRRVSSARKAYLG